MCFREGSCKTAFRLVTLLALVALTLALPQAAMAAGGVDDPSLVFQLEGNVTDDASICFLLNANGAFTATPSGANTCPSGYSLVSFGGTTDDWANIAAGNSHASATSFVGPNTTPAELINSNNDTGFTGGGSKDVYGITSWKWKNSKPQAKDDIEHAFAAAYTLPGVVNGVATACGGGGQPACDTAIYFGMTRWDNSGDATAGFWFFQDGGVRLAGGTGNPATCGGSGCAFSGHHSNGDLLIVSDFSQGGPIASIQAFEWSCGNATGAACDSGGSLVAADPLLTSNITCDPTQGSSGFCSITNATAGLTVPFGFINKSGQTTLDHGEILEGGINLNVIFPNGLPCFSTFMAETRASNSPTSTLSDLTPPVSFPLCGASITKNCSSASFADNGTTVLYNFSGIVKNTGIGNLSNVVVSDTPGGTIVAGSLVLNQPDLSGSGGVLAPNATAAYSGSFKTATISSTMQNTAKVNATSSGGTPISEASGTWIVSPATSVPAACIPAPGPLVIDKSCTVVVGSNLGIRVNFSGNITNNSGVQVSGITVTDSPSASVTVVNPTLNPGASTTYSGSYTPTSCSTSDGGVCAFTDSVTASGTGGAGTGTISSGLPVSATCHLCPNGACSAAQ